jgi:hypothetical protein
MPPQSLLRSKASGWHVPSSRQRAGYQTCQADQLLGILFLRAPATKPAKNRLHLDVRPDDQRAEVERLLALGASCVDIGQGEVPWVVLADPEGNEFCVLREI